MQLRLGHGTAKPSRELEQDPQPTLRPCHTQSCALWFRLERVKHIRSNCLLRRQKTALTSNIEAPRDTTEEFPLAGVCGKLISNAEDSRFAFLVPVTGRAAAPSQCCVAGQKQCRCSDLCLCEGKECLLSCPPALLSSSNSSQNP